MHKEYNLNTFVDNKQADKIKYAEVKCPNDMILHTGTCKDKHRQINWRAHHSSLAFWKSFSSYKLRKYISEESPMLSW
jgi:hypothetical protein